MARIWKEQYKPAEHFNWMYEMPVFKSPDLKLVPRFVYLVTVCSFTFEFHSSSRLPVYTQNLGGDHDETQRWFERFNWKNRNGKKLSGL
jgi:hypothetical protein